MLSASRRSVVSIICGVHNWCPKPSRNGPHARSQCLALRDLVGSYITGQNSLDLFQPPRSQRSPRFLFLSSEANFLRSECEPYRSPVGSPAFLARRCHQNADTFARIGLDRSSFDGKINASPIKRLVDRYLASASSASSVIGLK